MTGKITAYVGEGEFTDDPLNTFGTRAVVHVNGLPALMHVICQNGFEHHAAMNRSHTARRRGRSAGPIPGMDDVSPQSACGTSAVAMIDCLDGRELLTAD